MEDHLLSSLWDLRFHGIQLSKNSAEHGEIHEKYEAKISYNWDVKERIIFNPTTVRDKTEKTFVRYRNINSHFSVRLWRSTSWFHFTWEHLELERWANLTDLTHTHRNRAGTRISISWAPVQTSFHCQVRNPRGYFCPTCAETSQFKSLGGYSLPQQHKNKLCISSQSGLITLRLSFICRINFALYDKYHSKMTSSMTVFSGCYIKQWWDYQS